MNRVSRDNIMSNNNMTTSIASLEDKLLFRPKFSVGTSTLGTFFQCVNKLISPNGGKRRPLSSTEKKSHNLGQTEKTTCVYVIVPHSIAKGKMVHDLS